MTQHFKTIIVGTGFAGIAMGAQLKRHGDDDFIMIDRGDAPGGTWRDNTYPGAACDVPSHLYSFSFRPNPNWSAFFAPGPEIQRYVLDTVEAEGLTPHLRLNHNMDAARWDEADKQWHVQTPHGEFTSDYLVTGTGHLADEAYPNIPGLDTFTGPKFHTARWDSSVDLEGKRIGVVGTGASAIQLIPEMAKVASELVVFQRTPAWVSPRPVHTFTEAEKRLFRRDPEYLREYRENIFWTLENSYAARRAVPQQLAATKDAALAHLAKQVEDPELRAKLTPTYAPGCKRLLLSNDYYPAMAADVTTVEASALASVDGSTLTAASGNTYDVDVLIFATGFEATEPPFAEHIFDGAGKPMSQHWETGMQALDSTSVTGFPNLFVINGPNTSLGHNSIVYIIEAQVEYILGAMDYATAHGADGHAAVLEPRKDAEDAYVERITKDSRGTVWIDGSCDSWYVDSRSGRLTLIWPDFGHAFRNENSEFKPENYALA